MPGPLRPATDHAVEALELRVGGMQGLLDTFKATKDDDSKNATAAGEKLAAQARRLEASDVVWQYLFRVPAQATLQDEGLGDVTAPAVGVRGERRAVHGPLDDGDLAAHPRRLDRRHPVGCPRHRAREGRRAAGRHPARARHRDDDQGLDRPRLRGLRQEHRREPGGQRRGDADDPEGHDADREEADDRPARHRRDQDGHVQGLPRGRRSARRRRCR